MQRRTNREILDAARHGIEAVVAKVREYEARPGARELAEHLIRSDDREIPTGLRYPYTYPSHPEHRKILAGIRDAAILRLWSRTKVVYAMDDRLLGYLLQSSASEIPTQVFSRLPHPNPYILLPKPDLADEETAYFRSHIGVPWGVFVFGRYNEAQQMCSTQNERREDLGLMFVGCLETKDGPVLQTLRCTIPLRERTVTIQGAVDATIAKFIFSEDLAEDDQAKLEVWLRRHVTQVFNSLLYVCTDSPDIVTRRADMNRAGKAKKRARRRRMTDVETLVEIGFRMGPTLHAAHQRWARAGQRYTGTRTGGRQPPHRRGPHYQTYWTGPGRRIARLRWIAPYWVSTDLLDTDKGPNQVVVRPVKKRP